MAILKLSKNGNSLLMIDERGFCYTISAKRTDINSQHIVMWEFEDAFGKFEKHPSIRGNKE